MKPPPTNRYPTQCHAAARRAATTDKTRTDEPLSFLETEAAGKIGGFALVPPLA